MNVSLGTGKVVCRRCWVLLSKKKKKMLGSAVGAAGLARWITRWYSSESGNQTTLCVTGMIEPVLWVVCFHWDGSLVVLLLVPW